MFNKSQDNGNCGKRNDREEGPGVPKNKCFLYINTALKVLISIPFCCSVHANCIGSN